MLGDYRNKSMGQKATGRVTIVVKYKVDQSFEMCLESMPFERIEAICDSQCGRGELRRTGQNKYEWVMADAE